MKIRVALFASAKDLVGANSVELSLPEPATVKDLRIALIGVCPGLGSLMANSLFSVDHEYADDQCRLHEGVEVALIPPVSGG